MPRKDVTTLVNGKAFPARAAAETTTARPTLIALLAEATVETVADFTVRADFEVTAVIELAAWNEAEPNFDLVEETPIVEDTVRP